MLTRGSLIGVICFAFIPLISCATVSETRNRQVMRADYQTLLENVTWKADTSFKASEIFPLHVGDKWVYRLSDGSSFTRTITGTDEICGKMYMRMETSIGEKWWMISDETGIWLGKIQYSDGSTITFCPTEPMIDGIFYPGYSKETRFDDAAYADAEGRTGYTSDGFFMYEAMIMGAPMFVGDTPKYCLIGSFKISYGEDGKPGWNMESWSVSGLGQVKFTGSPNGRATILERAIIDGREYNFSFPRH